MLACAKYIPQIMSLYKPLRRNKDFAPPFPGLLASCGIVDACLPLNGHVGIELNMVFNLELDIYEKADDEHRIRIGSSSEVYSVCVCDLRFVRKTYATDNGEHYQRPYWYCINILAVIRWSLLIDQRVLKASLILLATARAEIP